MRTLKQKILDTYPDEEFLFADGFDTAILGVDLRSMNIVYSKTKCIDLLMKDMDYENALDYFEFNVVGSYMGEKTPIFIEDTFY